MDNYQPFTPPTAPLAEPDRAQPGQLELASRRERLNAILIDGLLVLLLFGAMAGACYAFLGWELWKPIHGVRQIYVNLAMAAASLGLFFILNGYYLVKYGQTIGKRSCKIRIARLDGSIPALRSSFVLRYCLVGLIKNVPVFGPLFGLVDVLWIFRKNRRCLHDLVAGTMVVKVS